MMNNYRRTMGVTRVVVIFGIIYGISQAIIGVIIHDLNPWLFIKAQTNFSKEVYMELLQGWQHAGLMPNYFHHYLSRFFSSVLLCYFLKRAHGQGI